MTISHHFRLWLYICMAVLPVWLDFFKLSTDFTLRGLAMPIIASLNAAVIVALAKTSPPPDTTQTKITEVSGDKKKETETITEKHPQPIEKK